MAVLREDWINTISTSLGKALEDRSGWKHDPLDPVRYMAAPSNIINQAGQLITGREVNSPIYVPNPIDPLIGLMNMGNMSQHSVTNPLYMQHIDPELKESLK